MPDKFYFEYPFMGLFLLLFLALSMFKKKRYNSYYIPHIYQHFPKSEKKQFFKTFLIATLLIAIVIALASPVRLTAYKSSEDKGIDIVLALDASGSMSLTGLNDDKPEQSRWAVVKDVVRDFIDKREDDRIGIIVFGSSVAIASPLSHAKETQLAMIDSMELGLVGKSTALVDGFTASISLLKKSKNRSKVIVLLSDGEDSTSKVPLSIALAFAKKYEIKVYTIAIGEGRSNILKLISQKNEAQSFYVKSKEDLYAVYRKINEEEKSALADKRVRIKEYLSFYAIAIASLAILALLLIMRVKEEL